MYQVRQMKPVYTKVSGEKLRLVFANKFFSIMRDDEVFEFIPLEEKEIVVNLTTMQVENLSDVFVFERGNRFIRLPLYQLLLTSNVHDYLMPILDSVSNERVVTAERETVEDYDTETLKLINHLEGLNLSRAIDEALDRGDKALFMELSDKLMALN